MNNTGNSSIPRYSIWTATAADALRKEVNKVLGKHDLVANARRDARLNLPPANAIELSQVEEEVVRERSVNLASIEEALQKETDKDLVAQRALLDECCESSNEKLLALPRLGAIERDNLMEEERARLISEKEEACQTKRDLNLFRRGNPETARRSAKVVTTPSQVFWITVVLLITVIEAVFNAYFWADSNVRGLAGGLFQAAMLTVGNVVPAWLAGKHLFPRLHHVKEGTRTLGWLGLLLWLGWLVGYNTWLGHYRIAAEVGGGGVSALTTLMSNPLGLLLTSAEALLLTVVGMLASLIVAIKISHLDDPYLGYGAVTRRCQQARDSFDRSVSSLRTTLANKLKERLAEIAGLKAAVVKTRQKVEGLTRKVAQRCEEGRNSQAFQQAVLDAVIGVYRDEQSAIRTSVSQYFATIFPKLPLVDFSVMEEQASQASQEMARFLEAYSKDAAAMAEALTQDTETALRNLENYLDNIAEAAATRLNDQAVDYYKNDI